MPRTPSSSRFALELDVMRGFAAALMVFNHAGYQLLRPYDASEGPSGAAVFIGSFAPVLFFFASGFGMGLGRAASGRAPPIASTLWKGILLVLADQVAYWLRGAPFGLDFFSFIGIGISCLAVVARTTRPVSWSLALVGVALVLRFAIGPFARDLLPPFAPLDAVLGIRSVENVSYPLAPWIAFPLGGFALGCLYRVAPTGRPGWQTYAAVISVATVGLGAWMIARGSAPSRWGTMNSAFFVLAIGQLAVAAIAAKKVVIWLPTAAKTIALGGVASFAVIPVHYALIAVVRPLLAPLDPQVFFADCLVIVAVTWMLARGFARAAAAPTVLARPALAYAICGTALIAFLIAVGARKLDGQSGWSLPSIVLIQLAIGAVLGFRGSATAEERSRQSGAALPTGSKARR